MTSHTLIMLFTKLGHSSGPYAAFLKGGLHGGVAQTVMLWALAHSLLRGVWGHAPPENLGNLDSLRASLGHSDSDLQFYIEYWLIG
jgi:hypothetical protein